MNSELVVVVAGLVAGLVVVAECGDQTHDVETE
jgi:hypothetical protein